MRIPFLERIRQRGRHASGQQAGQGLTRRSLTLGLAGAVGSTALPKGVDAAMQGWQFRAQAPNAAAGAVYKTAAMNFAAPGVPVDDFPVGRTSTNVMALAVKQTKPILAVSGTPLTFGTGTGQIAKGNAVTLTIDLTKYKGRFDPGNSVTFASTSNGNYFNGTVATGGWVVAGDGLSGQLTVNIPNTSLGVGGVSAGSNSGPVGGSGTVSDWQLNLHCPASFSVDVTDNDRWNVVAPTTADTNIVDWDFSTAKNGFSGVGTATAPYAVNFSQCYFDLATLGTTWSAAAYFNMGSVPYRIRKCTGLYNWNRFVVKATVTAVANPHDGAITVDMVPNQHPDWLKAGVSLATAVDGNWRIFNNTNIGSMRPVFVGSISGNTININQNFFSDGWPSVTTTAASPAGGNKVYIPASVVTTDPQGLYAWVSNSVLGSALGNITGSGTDGTGFYITLSAPLSATINASTKLAIPARTIRSTVSVGDELWFWPHNVGIASGNTSNGIVLGGNLIEFSDFDFDVPNDFMQPGTGAGAGWATKMFVGRGVLHMLGSSHVLHGDFHQRYAWSGIDLECGNIVVNYGFHKGDERYAPAFVWNNPRDMTVGKRNAPFMNAISHHDFLWNALPSRTLDNTFYEWDIESYAALAIGQNAQGNARVTIGGQGFSSNGGSFIPGDTWKFGGFGAAALNGGQNIAGGSPNFTGTVNYSTNAASASGQNNVYFAAATITGSGGNLAQGSALFQGSTLLGTITAVAGDNSYVTLDTTLAATINSGTGLTVQQWVDLPVAFAAGQAMKVTTAAPAYGTTNQINVNSVAGIVVGMRFQSNQGTVPINTFVTAISGTSITLSKTVTMAGSVSANVVFTPWVQPCNVGLTRYSNMYFRNYAVDGNGAMILVNVSNHASMPAWSIEGMFDADTGIPISFYNKRQNTTDLLGPMTSWDPALPAPALTSITKVGSGVYKANLGAAITGALGYQVSLDGGAIWTTLAADGSFLATAGSYQAVVRAMNAANDLGVPVNPGAASIALPVTLAA